jgi:hypothetical protein
MLEILTKIEEMSREIKKPKQFQNNNKCTLCYEMLLEVEARQWRGNEAGWQEKMPPLCSCCS